MAPELFKPLKERLFFLRLYSIKVVVLVAVPGIVVIVAIVVGARILIKPYVICYLVLIRILFSVVFIVSECLVLESTGLVRRPFVRAE